MDITLSIYITVGPNLVRTMMVVGVTGANHTFSWDGKDNSGSYLEAKPYTYNVSISQLDTNADGQTVWDHATYRSTYLQILRATDDEGNPIFEAEFHEYDDKGTPEEEDDDYIYIVRHYALRDGGGLDASEGEIWLFNPDLDKVKTWSISSLECLKHDGNDGLEADEQGIAHSVLVPVPVGMMNDEGEYIFVVHAKDDHAPEYRNHEKRWARELNSKVKMKTLHVEDNWMIKPNGTPEGIPLIPRARAHRLKKAFARANVAVHTVGSKCFGVPCVWAINCGPLPSSGNVLYPGDRFIAILKDWELPLVSWRNRWQQAPFPRYVHVIGAHYHEEEIAGSSSMTWPRWCYVFVQYILDSVGDFGEEAVLQVTIHELGHQMGLADHSMEEGGTWPDTRNGKLCVMGHSGWGPLTDFEFCDDCVSAMKE